MPIIPAFWEAKGGGSLKPRNSRPATQEAEAGESLEPGRWRFEQDEIVPMHCSLVTEQDSVSKKQINKIICILTKLNIQALPLYGCQKNGA